MKHVCLPTVSAWILCAASAFAQPQPSLAAGATPATAPAATAVSVSEGPTLDGNVLDDAAWQQAPIISGFWQEQPDEGQPASENTEVRIIFTRDTLYVGVVCYDRNPASIIMSDSRRDADLDDTDSFRVIFDTYSDRQNGFVFGTNPAAIEYDGQVTNEGRAAAACAETSSPAPAAASTSTGMRPGTSARKSTNGDGVRSSPFLSGPCGFRPEAIKCGA